MKNLKTLLSAALLIISLTSFSQSETTSLMSDFIELTGMTGQMSLTAVNDLNDSTFLLPIIGVKHIVSDTEIKLIKNNVSLVLPIQWSESEKVIEDDRVVYFLYFKTGADRSFSIITTTYSDGREDVLYNIFDGHIIYDYN